MSQNAVLNCMVNIGQALYGERWQTDLGRDLGHKDGRQIRQWIAGDRSAPESLLDSLKKIMETRHRKIMDAANKLSELTRAQSGTDDSEYIP